MQSESRSWSAEAAGGCDHFLQHTGKFQCEEAHETNQYAPTCVPYDKLRNTLFDSLQSLAIGFGDFSFSINAVGTYVVTLIMSENP